MQHKPWSPNDMSPLLPTGASAMSADACGPSAMVIYETWGVDCSTITGHKVSGSIIMKWNASASITGRAGAGCTRWDLQRNPKPRITVILSLVVSGTIFVPDFDCQGQLTWTCVGHESLVAWWEKCTRGTSASPPTKH